MTRKRICIIDDDPTIRMIVEQYLKEDYAIIERHTGIGIRLCLHEEKIDLVILDIYMQIQDGLETLEIIKQYNPDLPIIMISVESTFLEMTPLLGAAATMKKPLDLGRLRKIILELLPPE